MKRKVILSSVAAVSFILIIILVVILLPKGNREEQAQACQPYLNISAIAKTEDLKSCDCLINAVQKSQCQANISDATLFTKAVNQTDISLCNSISSSGMKSSCIRTVKDKIAFIKQNEILSASSTNKQ
jgi:hypothetical protein